jgi:hypothetical protein
MSKLEANGDAPNYLARQTWPVPAAHAGNATSAAVPLYRKELARNHAYATAISYAYQHPGPGHADQYPVSDRTTQRQKTEDGDAYYIISFRILLCW